MNKLIYIFLVILLGLTSCTKDDNVYLETEATGKVKISFGITLPESPKTKVMADLPDIDNLRVAVFGGSGYLKEYVEADFDKATTNGDAITYNYTVKLSLTDSRVRVHFIANGPAVGDLPFRYEDEVMSSITSSGTQDAYWQSIIIPDGIQCERYPETDLEHGGDPIKDVNGDYIVKDVTKNYFQKIPLIRNFAKFEVESSTSKFTVTSYALVNTPNQGTIAVYNKSTNEFVRDYKDKTYDQLRLIYPGNFPSTATINTTVPAKGTFTDKHPVFMFERPISEEKATFLLVRGMYKKNSDADPKDCFYRIDLIDDNGYYPIYRNFLYSINITDIEREGSDTPEEAAKKIGGDVSTVQEAKDLVDVSDGVARILVQCTDTTFVGSALDVSIKYKFLPESNESHRANGVWTEGDDEGVEIVKVDFSAGTVIDGDITRGASDDSNGWRTFSFRTTQAADFTKTETIKLTGHYKHNGVASKIYRTIALHLMNLQTMQVICSPDDILEGKDQNVNVLIKIPKGLPRSLFPLQLQIESDNLSIAPNNDNLPVEADKSIIDNRKNSYHFIKTVSYDDYKDSYIEGDEWVTITTKFKTIKSVNRSKVYVANKYFNTASGEFTTYTIKDFSKLRFSNYFLDEPDEQVTFSFKMNTDEIPSQVDMILVGLKLPQGTTNPVLVDASTNTYRFTTGGNSTASIGLLTSNDGGFYSVTISAKHYNDATLNNGILTIDADVLAFDFRDNWTNQRGPADGGTVKVHAEDGTEVGQFVVNGSSPRSNSTSFTIDLTKCNKNENLYFSFERNYRTYRTRNNYTITRIQNAEATSELRLSISNYQ